MREIGISVGNLESRRNRIPERWVLRDDRSALGRMRSPLAAGRTRMPPQQSLSHRWQGDAMRPASYAVNGCEL